jgi:hypothetical protein
VKGKKIIFILMVGFIVRLILLLYQYNVGNLPQAGADTIRFERVAHQISIGYDKRSFFEVISNGAHLHSYIGSIIYDIFGREPIIWSFFFILLGIGVIYNVYRSVLLTTNNFKIANRSAWIACLFPNLAIFSVVLLREIYILFFLSLAMFYLLKYIKYKKTNQVILFVFYALIGALFHSAVLSIIIGFIIYIILFSKKTSIVIKAFVLIISFTSLYYINLIGIGLDKFGGSFEGAFEQVLDGGGLINEDAGSNYPTWLWLKGGLSDILLLPIRIIAFLFAPLIPFIVKNVSHFIGLIDAFFYLLIFYNIFKNRFFHRKNDYSKAILILALTTVIAFSFGASNFGTNIRHRAKILPIILMIPLLNYKEKKHINQTYKFK